MELQNSGLSFNSNASLQVVKDQGALLESSATGIHSTSQNPNDLEQSANLAKTEPNSSVVTQLVAGPAAAAALYGELVAGGDFSSASSVASSQNSASNQGTSQSSKKIAKEAQIEQAELAIVRDLAVRDREVKAHEQTHAAIGGSFASAPKFDYTSGPDGRLYATSGEVSIDTSAVADDPKATLEKAQVIIRAALSVSEPSSADRQVAAEAKSLALKAMNELRESEGGEYSTIEDKNTSTIDAVEQQKLEREEYLAEEELKQAKQDRNEALAEARKSSAEASLEVLKEYNNQIHEIQEKLRQLNVQLVDSGAFQKLFPEGAVIDQNV